MYPNADTMATWYNKLTINSALIGIGYGQLKEQCAAATTNQDDIKVLFNSLVRTQTPQKLHELFLIKPNIPDA